MRVERSWGTKLRVVRCWASGELEKGGVDERARLGIGKGRGVMSDS